MYLRFSIPDIFIPSSRVHVGRESESSGAISGIKKCVYNKLRGKVEEISDPLQTPPPRHQPPKGPILRGISTHTPTTERESGDSPKKTNFVEEERREGKKCRCSAINIWHRVVARKCGEFADFEKESFLSGERKVISG